MTRRGAFAALVALAAAAGPASGQDVERECRCVDADGTEIERCTCFRAPGMEALVQSLGTFPAGQPRLGISIDPRQSSTRDAEGALVTDVLEDGPADRAGLRDGDVITSIDGVSLTTPMAAEVEEDFDLDRSIPVQRLLAVTRDLESGQTVEVEYLREGRRQTTMVDAEDLSGRWGVSSVLAPRFDARPFHEPMLALDRVPRAPVGPGGAFFFDGGGLYRDGLELAEVNPGLGAYFGAEEGVLVLETGRSSGLGLQAGDVVLRIGSREVDTPERFRRIMSSYGVDEDIDFHLLRDGEEIVVTGRLRY